MRWLASSLRLPQTLELIFKRTVSSPCEFRSEKHQLLHYSEKLSVRLDLQTAASAAQSYLVAAAFHCCLLRVLWPAVK